jgi:hypothetical protein
MDLGSVFKRKVFGDRIGLKKQGPLYTLLRMCLYWCWRVTITVWWEICQRILLMTVLQINCQIKLFLRYLPRHTLPSLWQRSDLQSQPVGQSWCWLLGNNLVSYSATRRTLDCGRSLCHCDLNRDKYKRSVYNNHLISYLIWQLVNKYHQILQSSIRKVFFSEDILKNLLLACAAES